MEIKPGKFVAVSYKLWASEKGEEPEMVEETQPGQPLKFVYGTGTMLESFEKALEGLKVGDKFDFSLEAKDAYGEYEDENVIELPKNIFEIDGKFDSEMVVEGAVLPMRDAQGMTINGTVEKITDTGVVMDFNHPMAGNTLHFEGEVLEVREPTEADIHSCGGDCSCDDQDCESGGCGCSGGCH